MADRGIMLYGYGPEDAKLISETLEGVLEAGIDVFSASGQESRSVMEVLEAGPGDVFEDGDDKVLMVLGFSEPELEATLKGFPEREGLARPIFCVLTPNNAGWSVRELVADLKREREYFARRRTGGGPPAGG